MINLLDNETQRQYRAARLNLKLRGYFALLLATLVVILAMFGGGVYLTWSERSVAETELKSGQASLREYDDVKKQAEDFTANLKIAKSIVNQEVLYSDMIVQIAKTLPNSAVLSSLALDQTTLTKPVSMAGRVKTKSDAIVLKNTLEASPLFESVNLNSIIEEEVTAGSSTVRRQFPVSVTLSMNVSKGEGGLLR